jgi:hypothetical protein
MAGKSVFASGSPAALAAIRQKAVNPDTAPDLFNLFIVLPPLISYPSN